VCGDQEYRIVRAEGGKGMSKLDDILERVAILSADQYGGFMDWETPDERAEVIDEPKQQVIDLMLNLMDDIDPFHSADWYVKLRQKVNDL